MGGNHLLHAQSLAEMQQHTSAANVDLILLHRPLVNIEQFSTLRQQLAGRKIFLLSDRPGEGEGLTFFKAGIVGYANTYISPPRLVEAVKVVLSGSVWIGQKIMQRLILETYTGAKKESPLSTDNRQLKSLTPREHEIAELVSTGQSNLEIAYELNISERTVKAHLSSIYAKTETGSRLSLALLFNQSKSSIPTSDPT